ncbi:MAG: ornithine carbamoyltransferase [Alphaproteobacteria bacterium]
MPLKDLTKTSDLTSGDFLHLIELSLEFKKNPLKDKDLLTNKTVVMYFNKPSTRTRLSFSAAIAGLGGIPVTTNGNELQLGRGETIEDTANVISRYAKAFVIRTYKDSDVEAIAKTATIPVINALTDGHHPCQSIADLMTLYEVRKNLETSKLAYIGDGNNVVSSLLEACALCGTDFSVATPEGYEPNAEVVARAKEIAKKTGSQIVVTHDCEEALKNADAVYGDVWLSMGDSPEEKDTKFKAFMPYQITSNLMKKAKDDAVFMHCLPAHREEEVTADVIDSKQSVVFDQAENRMHTSSAVLAALIKGELRGAN